MKSRDEILKEMYSPTHTRRLVFSTRNGKPYSTFRKYKNVKDGDILLVDGVELSIIKDGEFEEFPFIELNDYIEAKLKETRRNHTIDQVLQMTNIEVRDRKLKQLGI